MPWHFTFSSSTYFLKPRQIPFFRWATIVTLFFLTSTLNSASLGYSVSIPVYIIFRSGGTLVTMSMGWLIAGKRYTTRQIASVTLLTGGVVLATWSNARSQVPFPNPHEKTDDLESDGCTTIQCRYYNFVYLSTTLFFHGNLSRIHILSIRE